ncbi:MAG TPA: type VI secretion system protein TssA [Blastocatellia bacterium]|nr:type VI secretion system protein TssA [Blastocatellia bacterium]
MAENSVIDLEALLTPLEGDNPSGESLRYEGTYDQIKEARREDEVLLQGDWARDLKVADWPQVIKLATAALLTKTKDLQIAAWLTEGIVKHDRHDRWVALRDGLQLMLGLHQNFWETVYPEIDPEDDEGPLASRANVLAAFDARLAVIIKELPLTAGQKYSYLQYLESKQFEIPENFEALEYEQQEKFKALKAQAETERRITGDDWRKAKAATNRDFIEARNALINECWDAFKALDAEMDAKFARETPGLGELKKSLDEIRTLMDLLVKEKQKAEPRDDEQGSESPDEMGDEGARSTGGGGFAVSGGAIRSRQEALKRLAEIASFFRQTEPHSPVSYAVDRAVKWGNMPLDAWLADVLKEGAALESVREVLGFNTGNNSSSDGY